METFFYLSALLIFHKVTKSVDLHDFRGGAAFLTVSGGFLPSGLYAYEFLQEANV